MTQAGTDGLTASVILATYKRRDLLPPAVEAILADPATSEVVVAVDGCQDGSMELLQAMAEKDPRVRPLMVEHGGAPRAQREAVRAATGDVIVVLDDDEIVEPGAIAGHLRHHERETGIVVVGYMVLDESRKRRPGDFPRHKYDRAYRHNMHNWELDPSRILRNMWGGFVSMRREDYLRVTDPIDRFFEGYHGDFDFGIRCIEQGYRGVFDRSLRAVHRYERTRDGFLRDARGSGRNVIKIHRDHPTVLGPIDATFVDNALPRTARVVLNLGVRHPPIERLVESATMAAGHLHLWELQTRGAILRWAIQQKQGALEALSSQASLAPQPKPAVS